MSDSISVPEVTASVNELSTASNVMQSCFMEMPQARR